MPKYLETYFFIIKKFDGENKINLADYLLFLTPVEFHFPEKFRFST